MKKKVGKQNNAGFTLIEILIVTVMVGISFTAIYGLFAGTVKQDAEMRREVIAAGLAQEGVEMIRNMRDDNVLQPPSTPFTGILSTCRPTFEANPDCNGGGPEICIAGDGHYYACAAASKNTPFSRTCDVSGSGTTRIVTCTVSWNSLINDSLVRSVESKAVLSDWQ